MPGASTHPQPRTQKRKAYERSHRELRRKHSGIPRADGFNGFLRARPGEPGLLSPSPRNALALSRVDISVGISGPHDFAVRLVTHSSFARQVSTASRANVK